MSSPVRPYNSKTAPAAVVLDQHERITNGLATTDIDMQGHSLLNLGGSFQIINRVTRDIYLGKRTNGAVGTGDKDSPYSANDTEELDARLGDLATWAEGGAVQLMEDEFTHSGQLAWYLPTGCSIVGNGNQASRLVLDPLVVVPYYGINCIHSDIGTPGAGCKVANLIVDGNAHNLNNPDSYKINGVVLFADEAGTTLIEDVWHLNGFGDFATLQESFGLFITTRPGITPRYAGTIRHSKATNFRGNYGQGICASGDGSVDNRCIAALVDDCYVHGYKQAYGSPGIASCVAYGVGGGALINSTAEDCQIGIYAEDSLDLSVDNCKLLKIIERGIHLNALNLADRDQVGFKASNCTIELNDDFYDHAWGVAFSPTALSKIRYASVNDCTFRIYVTGNTPTDPAAMRAFACYNSDPLYSAWYEEMGTSLTGNRIDATMGNLVSPDAFRLNNRTLEGAPIVELADNIGDASPVSDSAFDASWNGDTTHTPSKNAVYDRIIALEKTTSFTPNASTAQWYRIMAGSGEMGGRVSIRASYSSRITDLEFTFNVIGSLLGVGTITVLRNTNYNSGHIDKIRISSQSVTQAVFLDILMLSVASPSVMTIAASGPGIPTLGSISLSAPTVGDQDPKELQLMGSGVNTSGVYEVQGTQVLGARSTGWASPTGTADKTTFATYTSPDISASYTEAEVQALADHMQILSRHVKAIMDAGITHGFWGT